MYLSQVFLRNHPSIQWNQEFGNKNFVDYRQPILIGFGSASFNPVRMMITLAYGIIGMRENGNGLHEIYNIWMKMIRA